MIHVQLCLTCNRICIPLRSSRHQKLMCCSLLCCLQVWQRHRTDDAGLNLTLTSTIEFYSSSENECLGILFLMFTRCYLLFLFLFFLVAVKDHFYCTNKFYKCCSLLRLITQGTSEHSARISYRCPGSRYVHMRITLCAHEDHSMCTRGRMQIILLWYG